MVEVVVVMVIISILMGMTINRLMAGRKAARIREATSAVHHYRDAIESFRVDHSGRAPHWGWPLAEWVTTSEFETASGPLQTGFTGKPYMRRPPEQTLDGTVSVEKCYLVAPPPASPPVSPPPCSLTPVNPPLGGTYGALTYIQDPSNPLRYLVVAWARGTESEPLTIRCALGSSDLQGTMAEC